MSEVLIWMPDHAPERLAWIYSKPKSIHTCFHQTNQTTPDKPSCLKVNNVIKSTLLKWKVFILKKKSLPYKCILIATCSAQYHDGKKLNSCLWQYCLQQFTITVLRPSAVQMSLELETKFFLLFVSDINLVLNLFGADKSWTH